MTFSKNPGSLREPLRFTKLVREANNSGGYKKVEIPAFKTFGEIVKAKAYNSFTNMQKDLSQLYVIKIRYSQGQLPKSDMIMYDQYDVKYIIGEVSETDTVRRLVQFEATKQIKSEEEL